MTTKQKLVLILKMILGASIGFVGSWLIFDKSDMVTVYVILYAIIVAIIVVIPIYIRGMDIKK